MAPVPGHGQRSPWRIVKTQYGDCWLTVNSCSCQEAYNWIALCTTVARFAVTSTRALEIRKECWPLDSWCFSLSHGRHDSLSVSPLFIINVLSLCDKRILSCCLSGGLPVSLHKPSPRRSRKRVHVTIPSNGVIIRWQEAWCPFEPMASLQMRKQRAHVETRQIKQDLPSVLVWELLGKAAALVGSWQHSTQAYNLLW